MELSYRMQIKHYNKIFRKTVKIYQSSVKYIIAVVEDHWYDIKDLSSNKQVNYIENLIHNTPYNVCQFTTGKIYNCDLNATYNISARYFIKQIENKYNKTFQTMKAKDPSLSKRSTCTLDSLIRLSKAI